MTITLRPYQVEAVHSVRQAWRNGVHSQLVAMATGLGKTEVLLSILAEERAEHHLSRALVIAHRKELIEQPAERIALHWTDKLPTPGIVMAERNECNAQIVIATIQTLGAAGRLEQLLRAGAFSHVIVDEAHHTVAASYLDVIAALRIANPHLYLLGVTATPKRTDGAGLKRVFERVAFRATIKDGIGKYKALSPFLALGVQLPVDISQVEIRGEDYDPEQLGSVLDTNNAKDLIIETWKKHASDRQTMVFTASVAQARGLAQAFQEAGIAAAWASGETPKPQRAQIINDFKAGLTQVVVNCALWTEGFDAPSIACIAMVRPTRSDTVYTQAIGRGLRLAAGKTDCLILDFQPLGGRDLIMAGDLLGKPQSQKKREAKALSEGTISEAFGINSEGMGINGDPDDVITRALDLFAQSKIQWTYDGAISTAGIGGNLSLAIVSPQLQRIAQAEKMQAAGEWRPDWELRLQQLRSYQVFAIGDDKQPTALGSAGNWDDAVLLANEYADEHGDNTLAKRTASWRHSPPSDKQKDFAIKLGCYRSNMSRGACAQAITHSLALQQLRRARVLK